MRARAQNLSRALGHCATIPGLGHPAVERGALRRQARSPTMALRRDGLAASPGHYLVLRASALLSRRAAEEQAINNL